MRLFPLELDSDGARLKAGEAKWKIDWSAGILAGHKPAVQMVCDPIGITQDVIGIITELFRWNELDELGAPTGEFLYFTRHESPYWHMFWDNFVIDREPQPGDTDEFPKEYDDRPKYWMPKNWRYGRMHLSIRTERHEFHRVLYFRVREKRFGTAPVSEFARGLADGKKEST